MSEAAVEQSKVKPVVRSITLDQPWQWLTKGWADLRETPLVGGFYGLLAAVTGYVITLGLWQMDQVYLILPMTAGFLIVGPVLVVGIYEVSRRKEQRLPTLIGEAVAAFRRNTSQVALIGVALLLLMIAWARLAAMLFMLYFGYDPPNLANLVNETFLTPSALPFLLIGSVVGGILAFIAFSISAISIPMLLDREEANVIEAISTSFEAVQKNLAPMLFWGLLIVVFTVFGLVTLYLGLIVTLPLIGHASWYAYRDLVQWPDQP